MKSARRDRKSGGWWLSHFDELALDDRFLMFRVEAQDYARRLQSALPVHGSARVLDFGCGHGFIAECLAPSVSRMWLWDAAPNMRRTAAQRLSQFSGVTILDDLDGELPHGAIDYVLVNSVVQYMSREELAGWLTRWSEMTAPSGQIVVSDIATPNCRPATELLQSLSFAAHHGFLWRSLGRSALELVRYLKTRRQHPLLHLSRGEIQALATSCNLSARFLPANLTHRQKRVTAVLAADP